MESKEIVSLALSTASVAFNSGYAQITADMVFPGASSVYLLSIYAKGRLLQGAKELNYYGTDIFYNSLTPTPYFILTSFRGGFELNNSLTTNKLLSSNVNVTGYIGTVSAVNRRLALNYDTYYVPRTPILLILANDKIGLDCYFKWYIQSGFSYYDSANLLGTVEIIAEFIVNK